MSGAPARQVGLAVIGFVATLLLLAGGSAFLGLADRGSDGSGPPASAEASSVAGVTPGGTSSGSPPAGSSALGESVPPEPSGAGSVPPGTVPPNSVLPQAGEAILVGAGDIADCSVDDDEATAALIEASNAAVFTAGDNVYPDGTIDRYRACYGPTWGRFLDRTRPAAGNHDWATGSLAGYLDYFGPAAAPDGKSWYAYELGAWHVIVLDSNCDLVGGCGPASDQGRWLADDLARSTARCTLAIWHHPRFSSGVHGDDPAVGPFWEALYAAGADLVVNGHDHDYERFSPQDPDARPDAERGIRQFVVGTGGADLRSFGDSRPNSQVRASIAPGVIRLVLGPTGYEWSFISTTGEFSDRGSGACH